MIEDQLAELIKRLESGEPPHKVIHEAYALGFAIGFERGKEKESNYWIP